MNPQLILWFEVLNFD
uniref:Uncharacterized protein n=1 Tax=Rhizophora mucronata TaxID=61149 RepID=A0A2P2PH96_RHIMU